MQELELLGAREMGRREETLAALARFTGDGCLGSDWTKPRVVKNCSELSLHIESSTEN